MNLNKPISKANPLPECCSLPCYTATTTLCGCKCKGEFHAAAILPFISAGYSRKHLSDFKRAQLDARNHRKIFVPPITKNDLPNQQQLPVIDAVDYI